MANAESESPSQASAGPSHRVIRWAKEPLLHFFVLGAGVFAVNAALAPEVEDDRLIVVSAERRDELATRFEESRGRAPTSAELGELVEDWIAQEMLYREGLNLGMDRDDAVVRNQVVRKMAYLYRSLAEVKAPDDATLREYLDEHRGRYAQPARYDFVHMFVPAEADADAALAKAEIARLEAQAEAGGDPLRLGTRFSRGRRFRRRTVESMTKTFDADFAEAVTEAPLGAWVTVQSKHGWHAVRVSRRHEARPAKFEQLREQLIADYTRELEREHARQAVEALRETYRVREEGNDDA